MACYRLVYLQQRWQEDCKSTNPLYPDLLQDSRRLGPQLIDSVLGDQEKPHLHKTDTSGCHICGTELDQPLELHNRHLAEPITEYLPRQSVIDYKNTIYTPGVLTGVKF